MRNLKWIQSGWTIGIGCVILGFLLSVGNDYYGSKPILSTIGLILRTVWNFIIAVLNFDLKVWWLIISIIIIIAVIYLIDYFNQEEIVTPDFCNYREGIFKQWRWTWNWKWNTYRNAWIISDLTPHCPNCDTPLLGYECPRCNYIVNYGQLDEPYKIEHIILDNLNRGLNR